MIRFTISIHSISDVITNSSTDLFVVNNDTKVDRVKEILKELLKDYNAKDLRDVSEYDWHKDDKNTPLKFSEVFEKPFVFTKNMVSNEKYRWDYETKKSIGKVIIEGCDDNSIPVDLQDEIENVFNATREHLG